MKNFLKSGSDMEWSGKYASFLEVLRASLSPQAEPVCCLDTNWEEVFDTACRHCLESVLFDYIKKLPEGSGISPLLAARWYAAAARDEKQFATVTALVGRQREVWKENGIDAVLLKGLECAARYPVQEHRALGDVDWWMRTEDDWNKALKVLKDKGIEWKKDSDGDIAYDLGGIPVEHHRRGPVDDTPEGTLLYLADHIFHHASVYGIGMRQICDYALASRTLSFDRDTLSRLAEENGYGRWLRLLDRMTGVLLSGTCPDKRTAEFLVRILESGNFGRGRIDWRMTVLAASYAPRKWMERWCGLAVGRMKRFL